MTDPAPDLVAALMVPRLLSIANAAQVLGCHPKTVRRRIADGSLPAVIEHGRQMVRGDELRSYIEGLDRPGASPRSRARRVSRDYEFLR
jgi:excisionase family DNA binding protein